MLIFDVRVITNAFVIFLDAVRRQGLDVDQLSEKLKVTILRVVILLQSDLSI